MALTAEQLRLIASTHSIVKIYLTFTKGSYELKVHTGHGKRGIQVGFSGTSIIASEAQVKFDNRDEIIKDYIASTGGLSGSECDISFRLSDGSGSALMPDIFSGFVTRSKISDDVTVTVSKRNPASKFEIITGSRHCSYIVNGDLCGLSGQTCNRTRANCVSNSNEDRFGGFRWALPPGATVYVDGGPIPVSAGSSEKPSNGNTPQWYDYYTDPLRRHLFEAEGSWTI